MLGERVIQRRKVLPTFQILKYKEGGLKHLMDLCQGGIPWLFIE